eukprot:gnl/TRDRNA2_/TRDRNA2_182443_c0_seq1.p1 gnl/TRDRNA2_/TRDRNA2_182443_c0~~gnl/TRDRNA2_/TRDRNA2_182443_c0_seq1.p1  ORF type:complete len:730 (+),score=91.41 gnl/TRDRNA2_/TRDRNA2_182443_c0_seq1:95-2284(+)
MASQSASTDDIRLDLGMGETCSQDRCFVMTTWTLTGGALGHSWALTVPQEQRPIDPDCLAVATATLGLGSEPTDSAVHSKRGSGESLSSHNGDIEVGEVGPSAIIESFTMSKMPMPIERKYGRTMSISRGFIGPWELRGWCLIVVICSSFVSVLKVTVDAYGTGENDFWIWSPTSTLAIVAWYWMVFETWEFCRPGLPKGHKNICRWVLICLNLGLRLGWMARRMSPEYDTGDMLALTLTGLEVAVRIVGSYIVVPLLFIYKAAPLQKELQRSRLGTWAPVLIVVGIGLVNISIRIANMLGQLYLRRILEASSYLFILPTLLSLTVDLWKGTVPGQHAGYALLLTYMQQMPWVVSQMFVTFRYEMEKLLCIFNSPWLDALAASGIVLAFRCLMLVLLIVWELIAQQVMNPKRAYDRIILLFPILLTEAMFLQAFLLSAVFLSPQYIMMSLVTIVTTSVAQGGVGVLLAWRLQAKARRCTAITTAASVGSITKGNSGNSGNSMPAQDKMAAEEVANDESDQAQVIDEDRFESMLIMQQRKLVMVNFAQLASYAVMFAAVCAESLIYLSLGEPDCCEQAPLVESTVGDEPGSCSANVNGTSPICLDRPGFFVKGLDFRCPRLTGRHKDHHRYQLIAHFALSIVCVLMVWILSKKILKITLGIAKSRTDRDYGVLDDNGDGFNSRIVRSMSMIGTMRDYVETYKGYLFSMIVFIILATLTAIRDINFPMHKT